MSNAKFKQNQEVEPVKPRREVSPFTDMEHMFEGFFPRHWMRPSGFDFPSWSNFKLQSEMQVPRMDVIDRDDEVIVRAEMPGISKDEMEVSLTENSVTISGESKKEEREEKGDYHRCEISRSACSRTVALPAYIDTKKSKAKFKDGILELTLPKTEKTKRTELKIEG
jgi:HSP20 family protein